MQNTKLQQLLGNADSQAMTAELLSMANSGLISMSVYNEANRLCKEQSFTKLFELVRLIAWES